jgi:exosome complex component RRP4
VLGLLEERPPQVQVLPLSGRYIPQPNDTIIGYVADVQGTFWLLDIGAPRWAPLHMTGTPWEIEIGETDRFLHVGDAVVVRVENLDATGRIGVTMLGEGLGRLDGGVIVTLSPAKIPRVIGRGGSMIQSITRLTGAKLSVGQNGRVWIDGDPEAIARARRALAMIEGEGHRPGLTERVEEFLNRGSPEPSRPTVDRVSSRMHIGPPWDREVPPTAPPDPAVDAPADEETGEY